MFRDFIAFTLNHMFFAFNSLFAIWSIKIQKYFIIWCDVMRNKQFFTLSVVCIWLYWEYIQNTIHSKKYTMYNDLFEFFELNGFFFCYFILFLYSAGRCDVCYFIFHSYTNNSLLYYLCSQFSYSLFFFCYFCDVTLLNNLWTLRCFE